MNLSSTNNLSDLPGISIVIIGLNVERFIKNSIRSVLTSNYPKNLLEVIYIDGGSKDKSIKIAKEFKDVKIIKLKTRNPSAAKGRNAGYQEALHKNIQFVDSDSFLHPDWLRQAVSFLKTNVAAVAGSLKERYPERNIYHRIANLEWNLRSGKNGWTTTEIIAKNFGGNVMIKKNVLLEAGGYDESLPAGEDSDLSYRIRMMDYKILRLNTQMASHDINMSDFRQYLRRAKRTGYVYARLAAKYVNKKEGLILKRILRIFGGTLTPAMLVILGMLSGFPFLGLILALLVAFRLLFKIGTFAKMFGINKSRSFIYSLHLAFTIYPQLLGSVQGFWEVLRIKLNNKMKVGIWI